MAGSIPTGGVSLAQANSRSRKPVKWLAIACEERLARTLGRGTVWYIRHWVVGGDRRAFGRRAVAAGILLAAGVESAGQRQKRARPLDGRKGKGDVAREPGLPRHRYRHRSDHLHGHVEQTAKRPRLAQLIGIHRRDVNVDVVGRAGNAVGAGAVVAIGLRGELPERVTLPVALRKMHADLRLVAGVPERQARQKRIFVAVVGDVLGCRAVGVEHREAADAPLHMAGEFLRVLQRHPLRRDRSPRCRARQGRRAGLGEIDEIVGLVDRIAGPRQVVGAPFQAKRLGYHLARLKQFARHRVTLEQGLAEPGFGFVAGAGSRAAAARRRPC